MRIAVNCGNDRVEMEVESSRVVHAPSSFDNVPDPSDAVRVALEAPYKFPALRKALTPDDQVTIVLDEQLPALPRLLVPILEHLASAGVAPEAMTLLCASSATGQPWVDDLPDAFQDARVEVHDPRDRKRLSYLATTKAGRRVYLNQRVVDSDQLVVLSGRRYDPVFGYSGAEGAIFPAFADDKTRGEIGTRGRLGVLVGDPSPVAREAVEIAWLLGAPFFVQVIEGAGDGVAAVVAGSADASVEGRRRQDQRWSRPVSRLVDVVVAGVGGNPAAHTFDDLAAAAASAARVVRPGGRIVLLSKLAIEPNEAFDSVRNAEDPGELAASIGTHPSPDKIAVARWAGAAGHARIALLSELRDDLVEELFATPLHNVSDAQRLLGSDGSCLFLDDAHKTMTILTSE